MNHFSSFTISHIKKFNYQLKNNNSFHIRDIFNSFWDSFLLAFPNLKIRPVVYDEVEKIRLCRTIHLGYTMYECSHYNNFVIAPHTCKSRFCTSCGNKYVSKRVLNSKQKLMKVKHRHIVFTIPDVLRNYFLTDRNLLNLLFDSVNETFTWIFNPTSYQNKEKRKPVYKHNKTITRIRKDSCLVPGFICGLHTYGRDLKWNPRIHVLITEGGLTNKNLTFKKNDYFNYSILRKTFQKILLDKLYKKFGSSFYFLMCALYKKHNNGFYVYAHRKQFTNIQKGVEYVMRYSGKSVMAESRITNIDYDNNTITYWYDDHKTNKHIIVTEHVYEFIAKLIRHIPKKILRQ